MAVRYEELLDHERARAWRAPPTLRFAIDHPVVTPTAITLSGELINDAAEPVEVIVFPAYLVLRPLGNALVPLPPSGPPRPPPVPPPPMRFTLGPHVRERYEARLALSEYRFTPGAEIELEWSFTFWNEPLPRGRVTVKLCGTEC